MEQISLCRPRARPLHVPAGRWATSVAATSVACLRGSIYRDGGSRQRGDSADWTDRRAALIHRPAALFVSSSADATSAVSSDAVPFPSPRRSPERVTRARIRTHACADIARDYDSWLLRQRPGTPESSTVFVSITDQQRRI